jgi:hypothetical protein
MLSLSLHKYGTDRPLTNLNHDWLEENYKPQTSQGDIIVKHTTVQIDSPNLKKIRYECRY